jgi:hypothetical protein
VSIYSLDTLKKEGAARIGAELLGLFLLVTLAYQLAVEPVLRSAAPDVYAQTGLNYSPTDLPDTTSEVTHLLLSTVVVGSFLYWRLYFTDTGRAFRDAVLEEYQGNP